MADDIPTHVPSRAHEIIVTCIVCSVLTFFFVTIRIYTWCFITRALGWDDYVALATLPFCIAYSTLLGLSTRYGMGLHKSDMPPALEESYWLWIDISSTIYLLSLLGYKMSILLLYLRVYNVSRPFRHATYAVMFLVFGYLFSNLWTQWFGCHPVQKGWRQDLPGHCFDAIKADYANGTFNCLTDMLIFILPLPMIWRLRLDVREKVGLLIIFMIGSLNWAVAVVRFVYAVRDLTSPDRTWLAADTFRWSVIEISTGLICSCVPVLKPLFRYIAPKIRSSVSHTARQKGSGSSDSRGKLAGTATSKEKDIHINLEISNGKTQSKPLPAFVLEPEASHVAKTTLRHDLENGNVREIDFQLSLEGHARIK